MSNQGGSPTNWPEYLGPLGTALSIIAALVKVWIDGRRRRSERRARAVDADLWRLLDEYQEANRDLKDDNDRLRAEIERLRQRAGEGRGDGDD